MYACTYQREKFSEQEKLEEENIQSLKLVKKEHAQVELKRLENLKVEIDISTEVFNWEMVVSFDMSNLDGMDNYSMIHTPMKYGLKLSKSKVERRLVENGFQA